MIFRMIRGALFRQKSKMLLIAITIALGASLATGMLNVMLDVGDKVNQELKAYGANITVKPKDSSLLSDIYNVEGEDDSALQTSYLREDELPKIKNIFWAFNIVEFSPFLESPVTLADGSSVKLVGTWFNHYLLADSGEEFYAGLKNLRSWWDVTEGEWLDEAEGSVENGVMAGTSLAKKQGWHVGDTVLLKGSEEPREAVIRGIFDAGGDEDEYLFGSLALSQAVSGRENRVATIEVSAITTPDNDLARRAAQARNPRLALGADYDIWYCTAYVGAICYQIQEVITNSTALAVRQVAEGEGNILNKTELLMILITALSLVGAALGISNLVTASVMERSQEIGLLKAIGAHDGAITAVIMAEILLTALVGSVAGYFMGFGFAQLIGQGVFGSAIEMKPRVIPIVAALIALVTVAGSMPAIRMVLRLRPAEVLHGGH